MTDQTCQKWFCDQWFSMLEISHSMDDAPWSGRPVEVDSDQIETLIKNNQHRSTWEIADLLKISKSIKLLVKMKNVSFILQKKTYRLFEQPNNIYNLTKDFEDVNNIRLIFSNKLAKI